MEELGSTRAQALKLFTAIDRGRDGIISLQELVEARAALVEHYSEVLNEYKARRTRTTLVGKSLLEKVLGLIWRVPTALSGSLDAATLSGELTSDRFVFRPGKVPNLQAHYKDLEQRLGRWRGVRGLSCTCPT